METNTAAYDLVVTLGPGALQPIPCPGPTAPTGHRASALAPAARSSQ
jgi:hypothetical protein